MHTPPRLALAIALVASLGCGATSTPITVRNASADTLHTLIISGHGFSDTIPMLLPGASLTRAVNAVGESGIGVSFRVEDSTVVTREQGYLEGGGGYEGSVVIDSNHVVVASATLKKY